MPVNTALGAFRVPFKEMNMAKIFLLFTFTTSLFLSTIGKAEEHEKNSLNKKQESEDSSLMPIYGNWCGPEYPKDIENAEKPIDYLDSICMKHDYCYLEKGYLSCECDSNFTDSISLGLKENVFKGKERLFSHSFRAYFKNSPCSGDHSNKLAPTRAMQNTIKKASTVTKTVIGKIPFLGEYSEEVPNNGN